MKDAEAMTKFAASALGISEDLVLVASTGVIGQPLPVEKIEKAVPGLVESMTPEGFSDFAEAIMTTDTVPKMISMQGQLEGKTFTITGAVKGSGMIRPDMATMLCFVCSDIKADSDVLRQMLLAGVERSFNRITVERSFNRITVDGDTSTNDMVLLMANGLSGAVAKEPSHIESFQSLLDNVLMDLAKMVVKDGEGATKFVEVAVKGAVSDQDAYRVADTVAHSNLVKTALFGEDANWGRILAAAGRANVPLEPDKVDIFFDDVLMVKDGMGCGDAAEAEATKVLKKDEFTILIDLHMGEGKTSVFTCDFSIDYVKINADYRS